ncbi:hypothetical protein CU098_009002 [Rhizopus stolonifer]|uniref:BZIP domain-containing protein n=1 Tax=Rhizopus stolonifer TaxID=4846 RepID=A0A367KXR2_RHIST|nr:hypothetical protein CU098_009002 [Rhizopus stolonifer]
MHSIANSQITLETISNEWGSLPKVASQSMHTKTAFYPMYFHHPNGPASPPLLPNHFIPPPLPSKSPRTVIPSKRAEQNRVAQRAFRLRKERYVKELERKVKLMDDWKAEINALRQENQQLKETNVRLEQHLKQSKEQKALSLTKRNPMDQTKLEFLSVELGSPTTSCSSSSSSFLLPSHWNTSMDMNEFYTVLSPPPSMVRQEPFSVMHHHCSLKDTLSSVM